MANEFNDVFYLNIKFINPEGCEIKNKGTNRVKGKFSGNKKIIIIRSPEVVMECKLVQTYCQVKKGADYRNQDHQERHNL
jgi:hypothetical protein